MSLRYKITTDQPIYLVVTCGWAFWDYIYGDNEQEKTRSFKCGLSFLFSLAIILTPLLGQWHKLVMTSSSSEQGNFPVGSLVSKHALLFLFSLCACVLYAYVYVCAHVYVLHTCMYLYVYTQRTEVDDRVIILPPILLFWDSVSSLSLELTQQWGKLVSKALVSDCPHPLALGLEIPMALLWVMRIQTWALELMW